MFTGFVPNMLEAVKYVKQNEQTKMILDSHGDHSNSAKNWLSLRLLHGVLRKYFVDRARPHLSKIFAVVPGGMKFLHEVYKVPYAEMEVLPLGADIDLGNEAKRSKNLGALRRQYNIGPDTRVVITGGKLSPRKKTEKLIRAFNNLEIDDKCLLIVGDAAKEDRNYHDLLIRECG